jgi:hypothetical protein
MTFHLLGLAPSSPMSHFLVGGDPPSVGVVPSPSVDARVSVGVRGAPPAFRSLPTFTSRVPPPVCTPRVPLTVESPHPNPDGFAGPPSSLGGRHFEGHGVSPSLHGRVPHSHGGGVHSQRQGISFPSLGSTADHWHTFNFSGGRPLAVPPFVYGPSRPHPSHGGSDLPSSGLMADHWHRFDFPGGLPPHVPSIIHGPDMPDPSHGGSPIASVSVTSTLPLAAPPLHPLTHEDLSGFSALDLTMSFWVPTSAVVAPLVVPLVVPPVDPLVVPLPPISAPAPPVANVAQQALAIIPPSPAPVLLLCPAKPFKLPAIADAKAYLNISSIIQYYLRCPEFSTQRSDNALITDSWNAKVGTYWEGQVRVAVQDGSLHFLCENKGSMYDGKGFEMISVLNEHCRPDSVANAFITLMSLFNDNMGKSEEIMVF